ncbi:hypothetical protein BH09PSE6_BH09PSE6_16690 [soil metagenome]
MEWGNLWLAFALFLVIEGLLPLIAPGFWRRGFKRIVELPDSQIRLVGLISVLLGSLLAVALS